MTAEKRMDLFISENRNRSARFCRKPACDGNGQTFSLDYVINRGRLSAFMLTTER